MSERCGICKRPVTVPTAEKPGSAVRQGDGWNHRACQSAIEEPGRVYDQGYTEGAEGERAAIVAWLRAHEGMWFPPVLADDLEASHGLTPAGDPDPEWQPHRTYSDPL